MKPAPDVYFCFIILFVCLLQPYCYDVYTIIIIGVIYWRTISFYMYAFLTCVAVSPGESRHACAYECSPDGRACATIPTGVRCALGCNVVRKSCDRETRQ